MPLSSEQIYNDLNGEEVKQILVNRFIDLLNQQPGLERHLTLPRVKMTLMVTLEMYGTNPPTRTITDQLTVRTAEPETVQVEVIVDSSPTGQPPDEIRVDHGLPIMTPRRTAMGHQDTPIVRDGVRYAMFTTQDRGGPASQLGDVPFQDMPGQGVVGTKNTNAQSPAPVQPDFKEAVKR